MELLLYTYIFIVGLVLGSFFNVVGLRIPINQSIVKPRSACPGCQKQLTAIELIPVFSYLIQKGKCRNCSGKISPLYPTIELLTAILFTISPVVVGWSKELLVSWALISLFIIIVVSDLKYMIIPNKVLLFFGLLFIVIRLFLPLEPWWDAIIGLLVGFFLLLLIAIVSKGGMGMGDVKLFAILGLVLGWKLVLLAFFLANLFGTIFGLIGLLLNKVKKGKPIPFGPYIALATLVTYFYGEKILASYFEIFL